MIDLLRISIIILVAVDNHQQLTDVPLLHPSQCLQTLTRRVLTKDLNVANTLNRAIRPKKLYGNHDKSDKPHNEEHKSPDHYYSRKKSFLHNEPENDADEDDDERGHSYKVRKIP